MIIEIIQLIVFGEETWAWDEYRNEIKYKILL